jgi:hypothetical protein
MDRSAGGGGGRSDRSHSFRRRRIFSMTGLGEELHSQLQAIKDSRKADLLEVA